jgi:hypothetical protein
MGSDKAGNGTAKPQKLGAATATPPAAPPAHRTADTSGQLALIYLLVGAGLTLTAVAVKDHKWWRLACGIGAWCCFLAVLYLLPLVLATGRLGGLQPAQKYLILIVLSIAAAAVSWRPVKRFLSPSVPVSPLLPADLPPTTKKQVVDSALRDSVRRAYPDRIIIDQSPKDLACIYRDSKTALEAENRLARFMDKWMIVAGELGDIRNGSVISVTLKPIKVHPSALRWFVNLRFNPSWLGRLEVKQPSAWLIVLGRIREISNTSICLNDCDLVTETPPISPPPSEPGRVIAEKGGALANEVKPAASSAVQRPEADTSHAQAVRDARAAHANRVFLDETPCGLYKMRNASTSLVGDELMKRFVGKWVVYSATLTDLTMAFGSPRVFDTSKLRLPHVMMDFEKERWISDLEVIPMGTPMLIYGRLREVGGTWVELHECEIVRR